MKCAYIIYVCLFIMAVGCQGKSSSSDAAEMTEAEKRIEELNSYWDKFNFNDTSWLSHNKELEQVFAKWVDGCLRAYYENDTVLTRTPIIKAGVSQPMLSQFMNMADECFRNPMSPWRCEELYIPMLETALSMPTAHDTDKLKWNERLKAALMNRQGTKAADIEFINDNEGTKILHSIETDYTLLYFFNPGCHDCERVSNVIEESPVVEALIDCNKLTVAAIYPDEDLGEWNKMKRMNRKGWIVGRIANEKEREKYDLPAIPNLYLLDREKRVIIKDGTIEEIIYVLQTK